MKGGKFQQIVPKSLGLPSADRGRRDQRCSGWNREYLLL